MVVSVVAGASLHPPHCWGRGVTFGKREHRLARESRALPLGAELEVWAALLFTKESTVSNSIGGIILIMDCSEMVKYFILHILDMNIYISTHRA